MTEVKVDLARLRVSLVRRFRDGKESGVVGGMEPHEVVCGWQGCSFRLYWGDSVPDPDVREHASFCPLHDHGDGLEMERRWVAKAMDHVINREEERLALQRVRLRELREKDGAG